jgi:hypothetical protein
MAGSLVSFDYERAVQNIDALDKLLQEIELRPFLDLPETAMPGSEHTSTTKKK